ncbi:MAG: serine/threonine protein kinase [Fibrobacteres bacterium]|nr:serine/threonine protein kinase [Fibrobacterota bacterium]
MAFAVEDFSDWSLLGEGGEAQVFRARQTSLDRMVAIKRLKLSNIGDEEEIKRFEREAKLCASLSHPSVTQIFDYGSDGRYYYLVMEYVQGIDLGKMSELGSAYVSSPDLRATASLERLGLPTEGPGGEGLPDSLKVHLARQMVEVVDFIHQRGVLHRDIKPENFMADLSGRVKLLDLGMAKTHSGIREKTDSLGAGLKGTLAYLPPEILRGQGRLDHVSEYYSLALVILEAFSGARFYRGKSTEQVVAMIQSGIVVADMAGVPPAVKVLLTPYLDPDADKRPKSLDPLLKGLKAMQANTIALAGGREALEAVIRAEQRAWLWTMVRVAEASGEFDQAFQRLRELLEADPGDEEVQAKFRDLGVLMNSAPDTSATPVVPARQAAAVPAKIRFITAGFALLAVSTGAFFYLESRPAFDDAGRELREREMSLISKENDAKAPSAAARRPALRPYGVLIVTGVPDNYRVLVNKVRYRQGGEIHLPASRHLIEIRDAGNRDVLRDSVAVEGGEPTVYDFSRRAGKK